MPAAFPPPGSTLFRGDDGIWRPPGDVRGPAALSYPEVGHDACFEVEDGSFWFRHRNRCIVAAVRRLPPPPGTAVWDIGGGNGVVAAALAAAGLPVVLLEPGAAGARNARLRRVDPVVCARIEDCGLGPGSLGAAGLFDVVEHIADDAGFLRRLRPLLRPGAPVYLTTPAYAALWSHEDIDAGHHRRHTLASMRRLLESSGYEVTWASYIFRPLPLPIALLRSLPFRLGMRRRQDALAQARREHLGANGGTGRRRPVAAAWLERLLAGEVDAVAAGRAMRLGASCLVVARRI